MYGVIIQELLPQAIAIGIGYSEFWEMTPNDLQAYQEGAKKRIELEAQIFNHNAWLQGAYFQQAIGSVLGKNVKYPKNPLEIKETKHDDFPEMWKSMMRKADSINAGLNKKG